MRNSILKFTLPCGEGNLKLTKDGFRFTGIDGYDFTLKELEEIGVAINNAINLVDDWWKYGEEAISE